jgi:hypothetical protein
MNEIVAAITSSPEYTGGSVSYYRVSVPAPTSQDLPPYTAECNDIIEALGMNYAEGNAFKAIWRRAAAQHLGLAKKGYTDGQYDAEKVEVFGGRMVVQSRASLTKGSGE